MQRPAVIYGVGFWNRKSMSGHARFLYPASHALSAPSGAHSKRPKLSDASLFAWTTRLNAEQRAACEARGHPHRECGRWLYPVRRAGRSLHASSVPDHGCKLAFIMILPSPVIWKPCLQQDFCQRSRAAYARHAPSDKKSSNWASPNIILAKRLHSHNAPKPGSPRKPHLRQKILRILIPGQVSDDASIQKSRSDSLALDSGENPNLLLLKWVRAHHPDAHITFKPHPDVTNGLRHGKPLGAPKCSHMQIK